jgi:hypothetical protein
MLVGVKFCGGCNPRYDRGKALEAIKERLRSSPDRPDPLEFAIAREGGEYDDLLVIGGCTNCCAAVSSYQARRDTIRMWDESHIDTVIQRLSKK